MPVKVFSVWYCKAFSFMYGPAVDTLLSGASAVVDPDQWDVQSHAPAALPLENPHYKALRQGDVFVWVGICNAPSITWTDLHQRGVRTVYYRTRAAA